MRFLSEDTCCEYQQFAVDRVQSVLRRGDVVARLLLLSILLFPAFVCSEEPVEVRNKLPQGGEENLLDTVMRLEKDLEIRSDDEELPILARISDIAVDPRGRIFVAEAAQSMVLVYSSDGSFIRQIGREGEGPGELRRPEAIVAQDNELLVADRQGVSIFDETGEFVSRFKHQLHDGPIRGMAVNDSGYVFLSCFEMWDQKVIHKFSRDGTLLLSFCDSYAAGSDEDYRAEQVFAGGSIDSDPQGRICYSQLTPYEIRKFSGVGELTMIISRENDFMVKPEIVVTGNRTQFTMPTGSYGFCVLSDGTMVNSILASKSQEKEGLPGSFIDVFESDGELSGSIVIAPPSKLLGRDDSDRLYFLQYSEPITIVRYRLER